MAAMASLWHLYEGEALLDVSWQSVPPSLYSQVTFVGKLGASREKAQVLVGSFFARPQLLPSQPLPPMVLYSLEQQLLSQYLASRERLSSALTAYVVVTQRSLGGTAAVRQSEDHVSACYRNCFKTQVRRLAQLL